MYMEYYDNNTGYEVLDNDDIVIHADNEEITCRAKELLTLIGNEGFKTLLSNIMDTISVVGYTEVENEASLAGYIDYADDATEKEEYEEEEYFYYSTGPVLLSLADWRNRGFDVEEVKRKWKFSFLYTDEEFMELWEKSKAIH